MNRFGLGTSLCRQELPQLFHDTNFDHSIVLGYYIEGILTTVGSGFSHGEAVGVRVVRQCWILNHGYQ